jgi:hypothetical protein
MNLRPWTRPLLGAWIALSTVACTTTPVSYRQHPQTATTYAGVASAACPAPDLRIYQLTAAGEQIEQDNFTADAVRLALRKLQRLERVGRIRLVTAEDGTPSSADLAELNALFKLITVSIFWHGYHGSPQPFPQRQQQFTYSLGDIQPLLTELDADALLLIHGFDQFSSGGRMAMMGLGVVAAAVTGIVLVPAPGSGAMTAGLFAADGTLLWFNHVPVSGDLHTPAGIEHTFRTLFTGFPGN